MKRNPSRIVPLFALLLCTGFDQPAAEAADEVPMAPPPGFREVPGKTFQCTLVPTPNGFAFYITRVGTTFVGGCTPQPVPFCDGAVGYGVQNSDGTSPLMGRQGKTPDGRRADIYIFATRDAVITVTCLIRDGGRTS